MLNQLEMEYKLLQKVSTPAMHILHIVLQSKVSVQNMHACWIARKRLETEQALFIIIVLI